MTEQINTELRKTHGGDKFVLNGFFNEAYRTEMNLFTKAQLSPMFSTAIFGHYSLYPKKQDRNGDGFADLPEGSLITLNSRWDYHNSKTGWESQLNVQWVRDKKEGGHVSGESDQPGTYSADIQAQ